jgi:hypothetical protein
MGKFIAAAACAILLSGCVTAQSTMLTDSTARVTARGPHAADRNDVVQATLAEAAKLTRMHGYRYFTILMAQDASRWGSITTPGVTLLIAAGNERPLGSTNLGPQAIPGSKYSGPDNTVPVIRPGLEITIRMYREGEVDPGRQEVWNPEVILGPTASAR